MEKEARIFTISPKEGEDTKAQDDSPQCGDELNADTPTELPNISPEVSPILQGHVFKRSTSGLGSKMRLTSFKKRYFVLYEGVLVYYEHQSSYQKDKRQELKHGRRIILDNLYLTHTDTPSAQHCFTLHVPHKDNRQKFYLLAMSDRKSRNIWMEMLQQQNPRLEPSLSEIEGHSKSIPSYINMIRTLPTLSTPSPILRSRSLPQEQVHISELENYHYSLHSKTRRKTWAGGRVSTTSSLSGLVSREVYGPLSLINPSVSSGSTTDSANQMKTAADHEHRE